MESTTLQEQMKPFFKHGIAFKELLMKCPQHYLTEMQEVILFYNGLDIPTRQILDSRGAIPTKTAEDAKKAIQEMAEYSQKWHNGTSRGRSTETSDRLAAIQAQLNNLGREIKKVNEKVYAAQVGCEQCKGPHYTKDCPQKEEGKTLEEAYYTQFGGPFQGGGYRATAPAKRHEENSNLIKEIRAMTDAAIRNQGASIKTLEIQIGQMSKVLQERGFGSLPSSTETNPRDQVKLISTTIEVDSHSYTRYMDHPKTPYPLGQNKFTIVQVKIKKFLYQVVWIIITVEKRESWTKIHRAYGASHINNTIPRNEKDPGSFTLPCFINDACFDNALVDLGASIDVYKRKITLRVGEEKIIFKNVKPASSITKRVYMLSLRERMELDLEARLMGETLVLNRSLDPFLEYYIELNDLNEPFELRRNQGDDLMPTIEEGEAIEEFRTRDEDLDIGIDDYPILEDMDTYRDDGMSVVIFGEPFLREVRIKAKCFKEDIYPLLMVKMKNLDKESIDEVGGNAYFLEFYMSAVRTGSTLFQHTILLINATWRIYRANIRGVSHSNSF
ncbi:hypothetical protein Tco_1154752 [Tanacetum coccineum]